ncbi:MAG: hypothetical protein OXU20_03625 [Myxococcales bacterium]|nr:hypothetical protein [Myxococcales bacterium]
MGNSASSANRVGHLAGSAAVSALLLAVCASACGDPPQRGPAAMRGQAPATQPDPDDPLGPGLEPPNTADSTSNVAPRQQMPGTTPGAPGAGAPSGGQEPTGAPSGPMMEPGSGPDAPEEQGRESMQEPAEEPTEPADSEGAGEAPSDAGLHDGGF